MDYNYARTYIVSKHYHLYSHTMHMGMTTGTHCKDLPLDSKNWINSYFSSKEITS